MKGIIFGLSLMFAGVLGLGAAPASAASLSDAQAIAKAAGSDVVNAQYGGGGGGYSDNGRYGGGGGYSKPKRYDDDDDDGYRKRYRPRPEYRGGDYCWSCARRCADGWCPPRCWGWHRKCRRGGY